MTLVARRRAARALGRGDAVRAEVSDRQRVRRVESIGPIAVRGGGGARQNVAATPSGNPRVLMTRADQVSLAWALFDATSKVIDADTRVWVCTNIGAGDEDSAICDLLNGVARRGQTIPGDLLPAVRRWMLCFPDKLTEPHLRRYLR